MSRHTTNTLAELVQRLWAGDRPGSSSLADIDAWVADLPEDEAAALNACLGEQFGGKPAWDSDHSVAVEITLADQSIPERTEPRRSGVMQTSVWSRFVQPGETCQSCGVELVAEGDLP